MRTIPPTTKYRVTAGAGSNLNDSAVEMADKSMGEIPKASKYRAVKTTVDGITFDSKREADRYSELKIMQKAGVIRDLRLQVKFPFFTDSIRPTKPTFNYVADFVYISGDHEVIEDCKGFKTPVYRLKKKLIETAYNMKILET